MRKNKHFNSCAKNTLVGNIMSCATFIGFVNQMILMRENEHVILQLKLLVYGYIQ